MKKMWLALVVFVMIVSIVPTAFAETGYGKGDYKVFSLGDSEELTKEKYEYLINKGEITPLIQMPSKSEIVPTFLYKHFTADVAGHRFDVFLLFYNDLLYQMYFKSQNYYASSFDTQLKTLMTERVKPMFEGVYGPPTIDYGYPDFFLVRDGYVYCIAKWIIDDRKEIALRINPSGSKYSGEIIITDIKLEQKKEKDEEESEKQKVLGSASDFEQKPVSELSFRDDI